MNGLNFNTKRYALPMAVGVITLGAAILVFSPVNPQTKANAALAAIAVMAAAWYFCFRAWKAERKLRFYLEGSLDAVQTPITVTDLDMNWVFINKVTETLLRQHNLDKRSVLGKHCSNWKADICGTANCGINSLRSGRPQTHYWQEYPDRPSTHMQVDTSYILDDAGAQIGHIEIVTNVDAAAKLKTTTEHIASSLEETSASLEELSSTTRQTAEHCQVAESLMGQSHQSITGVNQLMTRFNDAMNQIQKASEETSRIIKTIDEISFQTNLLALNAAVEAARAGEVGQGFAVVADEVRNLAHRAAESAKNTAELIEKTVSQVHHGSAFLQQINQEFQQVVQLSEQTRAKISNIAVAANEQSQGIAQINSAVSEMSQVVQTASSDIIETTGERSGRKPAGRCPSHNGHNGHNGNHRLEKVLGCGSNCNS